MFYCRYQNRNVSRLHRLCIIVITTPEQSLDKLGYRCPNHESTCVQKEIIADDIFQENMSEWRMPAHSLQICFMEKVMIDIVDTHPVYNKNNIFSIFGSENYWITIHQSQNIGFLYLCPCFLSALSIDVFIKQTHSHNCGASLGTDQSN